MYGFLSPAHPLTRSPAHPLKETTMRTALTIARRELSAYFASPIAYLVAAAFLVISGYLFSLVVIGNQQASLENVFFNVNIILLFVAPLLTMRLLADEQRSGTLELLLTAP